MSLLSRIKGKGASGFGYGSTAEQVADGISLAGKTIVITGCNSGLGFETARVLSLRGAHVIRLARTKEKAQSADTASTPIACELSDPASVRAAVAEIKKLGKPIDRIICNAGIMALPRLHTDCGYERQFFTNHMGHFILVTGLLDQLTPDARVVILSSAAHFAAPKGGVDFDNLRGEKSYSAWRAYGQAKFANLLFAKELARRFAGTAKTAYAIHPGVIRTNLGRSMHSVAQWFFSLAQPLVLKSVPEGAATTVYVTVQPQLNAPNGAYFADCNVASCRPDGENVETAKRLWEVSEKIAASV